MHTNICIGLLIGAVSPNTESAGAAVGLTHLFGTCEGRSRKGVSVNHQRDPLM